VSPSSSVSIGGPGHDTFVFHPKMGTETLSNFNPQNDTIELGHFANVQSVQHLSSLITTDPHGEAFIDLAHSDGIAIPGVTATYLQAHLQTIVHLH
jgi:Ca2+-binding RTX toxin-like protein